MYAIRDMGEADISFIFSSLLRSYEEVAVEKLRISVSVYYRGHHDLLMRVLERGQCLMACDPEDPDQIYGYVLYASDDHGQPPCLHYLYVKGSFRRAGIGSALLRASGLLEEIGPVAYSHEKPDFSKYLLKYFRRRTVYDPYRFFSYGT